MPDLSPESSDAVHKAKNAQQAIEVAREIQNAKLVEDTAQETKKALIEGLKEVFGESDTANPQEMKVLVRRIPILCTNIANMHLAIEEMKDNQKWVTRAIIGGVIAAVFALIMN